MSRHSKWRRHVVRRPRCEVVQVATHTGVRFLELARDTIVYVSVYDEMPSPGAGLLRYARLKAGLSQSDLAKRAGVARTMVSAYEHDRRQATLPTLMRLLKAAGFEAPNQLQNPGREKKTLKYKQ